MYAIRSYYATNRRGFPPRSSRTSRRCRAAIFGWARRWPSRALRAGDARIVHEFESGYEKLGVPALFMQIVTGLALAYLRVPVIGDWFRLDETSRNNFV